MASKPKVVIFLDIDGVLNEGRNDGYISHMKVMVFNSIIRALQATGSDPRIVISSAWRHKYSASILSRRLIEAGVFAVIMGVTTPSIQDRQRAISDAVERNRDYMQAWIAIDDLELADVKHSYRTDFYKGITPHDADIITALLMEQLREKGI